MQIVDAHHHLWDLDANHYPWASANRMSNYVLDDLRADAKNQNLVKSVHVSASPSDTIKESAWLQSIADSPGSGGFPHGIIAFADFSKPDVEAALDAQKQFANVRGIRQVLSRSQKPELNLAAKDYLAMDPWWENFGLLRKFDLCFEVLIVPAQMDTVLKLVKRHPDIQFVLEHTGMPRERGAEPEALWRRGMSQFAECPNVAVKISGLGMSPDGWDDWVKAVILETIERFGVERCFFASNFPVDKRLMDYDTLWNGFKDVTAGCTEEERTALFHDSATRIYRL